MTKLLFGCAAIQPDISRSPDYDGLFPILTPEHVAAKVAPNSGLFFWLNIEVSSKFSRFFKRVRNLSANLQLETIHSISIHIDEVVLYLAFAN